MGQQSREKPTVRSLALELGLSAATVSLALRNHPDVAAATRRRVQEFAKERGYRLNPLITSFMSHVRSARPAEYKETIGWLNAFPTPDYYENCQQGTEYSRSLWQGAQQRASELGFGLDSFWTAEPGMTAERMTKILSSRGVRGLLLPPIPKSCGHLSLHWEQFAVSALSYTIARPGFHRVVPDHHFNMQLVIRKLRRRGFRRIGYLIPATLDNRTENRLCAAFCFFQQNLPSAERVPMLIQGAESSVAQAMWLSKFQPDAVITQGGLRNLRELNIGNPSYSRKLGVVLMGYASTDLGFAAVDENPHLVGANAVDQLALQLMRNESGIPEHPRTVLIKGSWIEGRSLT